MKLLERARRLFAALTTRPNPRDSRGHYPAWSQYAGVTVNQYQALTLSAVYACIKVISESIAVLPWNVYEQIAADQRERVFNRIDRLLSRAFNVETTAYTGVELLVSWAASWGNAYAEIERDMRGQPIALWPLIPERCKLDRNDAGELVLEVTNETGRTPAVIPYRNVLHIKGLSHDGLQGYSIATLAAREFGVGIAITEYAAAFFGNGINSNLALMTDGKLSDKARGHILESLDARHRQPHKAHRAMLFEEGLKPENLTIPAEDSQLVEAKAAIVRDVARWFRVPLHKLAQMENASFNNVEQENLNFITDTLMPWIVRLEQEANAKLFGLQQSARLVTRFDTTQLLRGDTQAMTTLFDSLWSKGAISANEMLRILDRNGIGPDGDKRFVPLNMTTLELAGEEPEPAGEPIPATLEETDDGEELVEELVEVAARIRRRERARVEDVLEHHAGDGEWLRAWSSRFLEEHRTYVLRQFEELAEQDYGTLAAIGAAAWWIAELDGRLEALEDGGELEEPSLFDDARGLARWLTKTGDDYAVS